MAGDFTDVSHLGNVYELVDKTLTVHLGQDAALVVVPATPHVSHKRYAAFTGSGRVDSFLKDRKKAVCLDFIVD